MPRQRSAGPKLCAHCGRRWARRPRGLCRACYDDPAVRVLHPAARGLGLQNASRPAPAPTDEPPGTEAKIRVLMARAEAGTSLWHPDDAQPDEE